MRVLELASLAPAPFGCMLLGDLGAEVLRLDRVDGVAEGSPRSGVAEVLEIETARLADPLGRRRQSLAVDLKHPQGVDVVLRLVRRADVLVEGFRPGVMERLGLDPGPCRAVNPRLVYARMTGTGQDGPLSRRAGHDINHLPLAGGLHPIGRAGGPPVPPLNLVADFGGGGMLLALGVVAALYEREASGQGQVVDAAMVDGVALLTAQLHGLRAAGAWQDRRGTNLLDGGAPFYDTYPTSDGEYVAVGALEPQFYAQLLAGLGIDEAELPARDDRSAWPAIRRRLTEEFAKRTRNEWAEVFAGADACVTPVLTPGEAVLHPHHVARSTFVEVEGPPQPAAAPRFSRTPATVPGPAPLPGQHTTHALDDWGFSPTEVAELLGAGAVAQLGSGRTRSGAGTGTAQPEGGPAMREG